MDFGAGLVRVMAKAMRYLPLPSCKELRLAMGLGSVSSGLVSSGLSLHPPSPKPIILWLLPRYMAWNVAPGDNLRSKTRRPACADSNKENANMWSSGHDDMLWTWLPDKGAFGTRIATTTHKIMSKGTGGERGRWWEF